MRQGIACGLAVAILALSQQAASSTSKTPEASAVVEAPADADSQWAVSLLLNVVFAAEYLAVAENAALDPEALRNFKQESTAALLAKRAQFVLAAARERSQDLGFNDAVERTLALHGVASIPPEVGVETIPLSLGSPLQQSHWRILAGAYGASKMQCPLATSDVVAFAAAQHQALAAQQPLSSNQLLNHVESWSPQKINCLIFALMGSTEDAKRHSGFDPLPLMQALRQRGHQIFDGRAPRALMAARLIQIAEYAEALRILMELIDQEPAFRLPYEIVQRVFGLRQRGGGAVALRGP